MHAVQGRFAFGDLKPGEHKAPQTEAPEAAGVAVAPFCDVETPLAE